MVPFDIRGLTPDQVKLVEDYLKTYDTLRVHQPNELGGPMSADFLLDYDNSDPYEDWNVSRGVLHWVVDFVADHVRDEELAASMKDFVQGGYGYFALSFYTTEQAAEIVRVIREDLEQRVEAAFPSTEDRNAAMRAMTADLIGKAERWGNAS